ncbi:MAG: hypothetical protein QMD80_05840 [archaeon]|nr:hypothetical protein [archaeon]
MESKVEHEEGREVSDPFEAGEICAGLSHAYRIRVMRVLAELGGKAKLADLIKECGKEPPFFRQFTVAKAHVEKMAIAGIVELRKEEGQYVVDLKKEVRVFVKDINEGG